jgi:hypothetical protein
LVDKVLFEKAERKIAKAKTPRQHAIVERHGMVEQRIHGRTYRLTWSIKRVKA